MRKIIIALLLLSNNAAKAQDFENVKIRYEADSIFTVHVDSNNRRYCEINETQAFGNIFRRIYLNQYCNFGYQPYQILPVRDSLGYILPAIIGRTNSANADFTLTGDNGNIDKTISLTDINSNYYTTLFIYREKFLFWLFADKFGLILK